MSFTCGEQLLFYTLQNIRGQHWDLSFTRHSLRRTEEERWRIRHFMQSLEEKPKQKERRIIVCFVYCSWNSMFCIALLALSFNYCTIHHNCVLPPSGLHMRCYTHTVHADKNWAARPWMSQQSRNTDGRSIFSTWGFQALQKHHKCH